MPKYTAPTLGLFGKLALVVLLAALVYLIAVASWTKLLMAVVALALLWFFSGRSVKAEQRRLVALAASRPGESICEFARSFDCRQVDTWVIRAVYEELQETLQLGSERFPVRASDELSRDLFNDDREEMEMFLVPAIAARAGRSMEDTKSNPYWKQVNTVADLVHFFNAQPHVANAR